MTLLNYRGSKHGHERPLHLCGMKPTDSDLSYTSLPSITRIDIKPRHNILYACAH